MTRSRFFGEAELVNGSTGDPVVWLDYPGRDDAILLDCGDNCALPLERLADLRAVFITHHHVDHFIGLDRIVRANIDSDKTVTIHGPRGTIRKVYDRIMAYEYPFFPFQRIVLDIVEIEDQRFRTARLDCGEQFPEPVITESERAGPVVFETGTIRVEACAADHTVPCLSYAVIEKPGWFLDTLALREAGLPLTKSVLNLYAQRRSGVALDEAVQAGERSFRGEEFAARFVVWSEGARLVYLTDTAMSAAVRPRLLTLAHRATRLYGDSFYLDAQSASAEKHRHSTARQAAEFARDAEVDELVLIHFAGRYKGRYDLLVDEARAVFPNVRAEFREPK